MHVDQASFFPVASRQAARDLFAASIKRVEVEVHSYCNRRCDYCPNAVGDRLGENRRISDANWHLILTNLREIDYAGNFVFSSYNEPLADRAILSRIRETRGQLPRARIMAYTNGDYLNSEYLSQLVQAGLDYLHVSIHTRPGATYGDVDALNHIAKLVKRIGTAIRFTSMKPGEFIVAKAPHPQIEIDVRAINYYRHGTDRGGLLQGLPRASARVLPCYLPFTHFQVGYGGVVVPCCHIRSDLDAHIPYRYGNLADFESIFLAYASRIATEWRRELISFEPKRPPCDTCTVSFLSQDPKVLQQVRGVWEQYVRDAPLLDSRSGEGE